MPFSVLPDGSTSTSSKKRFSSSLCPLPGRKSLGEVRRRAIACPVYTVEEILGDDDLTVSLLVRFTLPEHVTNTDGLELRFDDAGTGCALVVKTADVHGMLQQRCRASLPLAMDEAGMQVSRASGPKTGCFAISAYCRKRVVNYSVAFISRRRGACA